MSVESAENWRAAILARIVELNDRGLRQWIRVTVLPECASTQDAAPDAEPGQIITALRQTGGRGRWGRQWEDDRGEGIAASFVLPAEPSRRLAIAAAVATAEAIAMHASLSPGIKWPNDVIINGRKVAGVLVEQDEHRARIGIGINVSQQAWPETLDTKAVSLAQAGQVVDRLELLCTLIESMDRTLDLATEELVSRFARFDRLRGSRVEISQRGTALPGRVLGVYPLEAIDFQPDAGSRVLIPVEEASIVSVLEWPQSP